MNTLRNRILAALLLLGLVAFAFPADADADGYNFGAMVKKGASGQEYQWSPGGC